MSATAVEETTLTAEDIAKQKRNDEIANFVMPRPTLGQGVTWYANGTRTGLGEMAFVLQVGRRNIILQRASGIAMESVRHVDDPKLSLSAEQRASGAWDFTERDKQLDKLQATVDQQAIALADLKGRVATLDEFINEPAKPKKDKAAQT